MANTKISDLTASAANLASTDLAPVVQTPGVGPVKMTGLQLAGGLLGSATFNGATVTTSQPVLNLSQTWNAGAVTFTGLLFNATDTASASGSLLLDLQVGGASKASVDKSGNVATGAQIQFTNAGNVPYIYSPGTNTINFSRSNSGSNSFLCSDTTGLTVVSQFGFSPSTNANTARDTILTRAAAATLQLGAADAAAPVAQTLQVQSVVAGTTNTAGANFTINGSRGTGTGAGGSIIFQVAPAGSSGTAQNAYATALTINSTGRATFGINSEIAVDKLYSSTGTFVARTDSGYFQTAQQLAVGGSDLFLYRDAANTLALRNGANPQIFRVYNTYTSSTNYENFEIDWQTTANIALVGPTKGSGGGTQRVQRLQYLEDGGTGSTTPSLGTTCPAASATIKSWIKVITSDGTTAYIPCWA